MSDDVKRKLLAGGKVAVGAAQVVSGCLTGMGKGILGGYLRNHQMTQLGMRLAKHSLEQGSKRFKEGMNELGQ